MTRTRLGDVAHARAGDKGDTSILMLAPYDGADYDRVRARISPERLAEHFGTAVENVVVHDSSRLLAFTIVLRGQLYGGVTRATTLDPHGKSLGGHLLELFLDDEEPAS